MSNKNFVQQLKLFDADVKRLHHFMRRHLNSEVKLITEMKDNYLIGGKRLRAIIAQLSGQICHLDIETSDTIATAIEFIHTATLLHDDVVDNAHLRRHVPTANRVYGNAAAVLAGDFLYSRASQLFAHLGHLKLIEQIAEVTNQLSEGEILQLIQRGKPTMDEATYFSIIHRKTANLFSIAACAATLISDHPHNDALACYGHHLGVAFQLIDDCLDYEGENKTGKSIGTDFKEGKVTLPVILMLGRIDKKQRQRLIAQWQEGQSDSFADTLTLMRDTDALEDTRLRAQAEVTTAIDALSIYPDSTAKLNLVNLAQTSPYRQA